MDFSNLVIDLVWNFTPDGALIELGSIGCKHNLRWQNLSRMKNVLFCWIKNYFVKWKMHQAIIQWPETTSAADGIHSHRHHFKQIKNQISQECCFFSSATFSTFHPKFSSFRDKETLKARRPDWHFLRKIFGDDFHHTELTWAKCSSSTVQHPDEVGFEPFIVEFLQCQSLSALSF